MAAELTLYIDITNGTLVTGLSNREQFQLPQLFQGSTFTIKVYPVQPINSVVSPFYSKADITNLTLKMAIGNRAGTATLLASQTSWTLVYDTNATTGYLTATFNLNTTDLNTAIGSSDTYSSYFEIQLGESGVYRVVYQQAVIITSCVFDPTGAVSLPASADTYLTRAECLALFVGFLNTAGKTITLNSPDGTKYLILGVNNDGSMKADLI